MDITPVAAQIAEAHAQIFKQEHFYHNDKPQCSYKCVVGNADIWGIGGTVCICEFVAGHSGPHERVPTMRLATAEVARYLPVFADFISERKTNAIRQS